MTSDTRTPEEIERQIESERSALTSNLEDLQDRFSIDTLVRQIGDQFREHGGDMGRSISDQVKANPIPLALTGIGLAWMMFGNSSRPTTYGRSSNPEDEFRQSRLDENRLYTPPIRRGVDRDTGPSWSRHDMGESHEYGDRSSGGVAAQSADGFARGADAAGSGLSSAASSVADTAESAKSAMSSGADSVRSGVAVAGSRLAEGTEALTEEGRRRVISARQKAVEMKRDAMRSMSGGADAAGDFYERQPLAVGALALAIGAALGGALPRTKVEDDLMGDRSDTLFDEAERIFEEEKSKAIEVAKAVSDEVKVIAAETKADLDSEAPGEKTAAEALGDKAKSAADRVADAAKTAAEDENLGKSRT